MRKVLAVFEKKSGYSFLKKILATVFLAATVGVVNPWTCN